MLRNSLVEFVGEIGEREKDGFLGNAYALLFPIDWPEPFGLVMIEALACGTPVVARRRGSVPEVLAHGTTGFVCDDEDAMIAAVRRLDRVDRRTCRRAFEERFTAARMTADYVRVMGKAAGAIREASPKRLIFVDGLDYGNAVVEEMAEPGIVQSVQVVSAVSQLSSARGRDWPSRPDRSTGTSELARRLAASFQPTSAGSIATTPLTASG